MISLPGAAGKSSGRISLAGPKHHRCPVAYVNSTWHWDNDKVKREAAMLTGLIEPFVEKHFVAGNAPK
ncbi:hypothetical protein [Mesorhizobium vachelliae]|uniref:hypothetical protein n=1 Tax=Mesorhizobium vachelliae TaxID=3072309 RepID=UPI002A24881F|nr:MULTISPECIES: hypothetical protein [unclassified Mesorhizobium]